MKFYQYFLDGIPLYLARYYWWAYLWRPAVWFFDHQIIINAILFGQYKKLMDATMCRLKDTAPDENILQLTCVYGSLTPNILDKISPHSLHITDVAGVQLDKALSKAPIKENLMATRMNAEQLAYRDDAFATIVLFFLLHEMPHDARQRTLSECMRVIDHGGKLLLTEYAPLPARHLLYRFPLSRLLITKLEPFLAGFWQEDILEMLNVLGKPYGKRAELVSNTLIFSKFYCVTEYRIVDTD